MRSLLRKLLNGYRRRSCRVFLDGDEEDVRVYLYTVRVLGRLFSSLYSILPVHFHWAQLFSKTLHGLNTTSGEKFILILFENMTI